MNSSSSTDETKISSTKKVRTIPATESKFSSLRIIKYILSPERYNNKSCCNAVDNIRYRDIANKMLHYHVTCYYAAATMLQKLGEIHKRAFRNMFRLCEKNNWLEMEVYYFYLLSRSSIEELFITGRERPYNSAKFVTQLNYLPLSIFLLNSRDSLMNSKQS